MHASEVNPAVRSRVVGLLAGQLLASPRFRCPGADGATVEEVVVAEYPGASRAGWVPGPAELASRYPDLADALASFFVSGVALAGLAG